MTSFIYPIQGYWKWGGGFLDEAGFLDFAVQGSSLMWCDSALLVIVLGSRKGKYVDVKVNAMLVQTYHLQH